MDIDQRIEALTQSLEFAASIQRDNEQRWEKRFAGIATALQQDGENIRALARVAELHHERLSRLEG